MNGIDRKKYFCEHLLVTGYSTVLLSQNLLQYRFILLGADLTVQVFTSVRQRLSRKSFLLCHRPKPKQAMIIELQKRFLKT